MSWQQSAATAVFWTVGKLAKVLPQRDAPQHPARAVAPKSVTRLITTRPESIAGVPCTWIGRTSADSVIVYLHGGSYAFQAIGLQWQWVARLAKETGIPALFVDYALSGEAPFPRALDQTLAVIEELRARGVRQVVVAGDSAGGGLAVATAERLRDAGTPASAMILVSPWLDLTLADPAARVFDGKDVMLTVDGLREHGRTYAGETDPMDSGVSPLYGCVAGLPPTILHVGDAEMFLPDNTTWARALEAAGGTIEWHVIRRGFHVSAILEMTPEGRRARREQIALLRRTIVVAEPGAAPVQEAP